MANNTVTEFARELKVSADTLLSQLKSAGVQVSTVNDEISDADKRQLLDSLRQERVASPRKITVTRRETSTIRQNDGQGGARTIEVEVRRRRVFVKNRAAEAMRAEIEAQAKAQLDRQLKEKQEAEAAEAAKREAQAKLEAEEAAKKAAEEAAAKKAAEEKAAAEKAAAEKAAAEEAAKKIAGAFGKGSSMGNRGTGTTGSGVQGSPTGNSNTGKSTGVGGVGSWDLNGRSLTGSLPIPVYNVQDEGRVVVTIVVNPSGRVISTSINKRTNTVSTALRRAAEEAARKARFNVTDGVNNQTGTITYYFKLR